MYHENNRKLMTTKKQQQLAGQSRCTVQVTCRRVSVLE